MKSFEIPEFYRSPIISKVKEIRSAGDKRKQDFSPSVLDCGDVQFILARHFGFCFGVENAIEISYRAIHENPGKRIYLLSQMIHNPEVNRDLQERGIRFIQDTNGKQLIEWPELKEDDVVIIPAFGTTVEIENRLKDIGIHIQTYDTTCPFVTRVWKKSEKLGSDDYTVIIHGKDGHEETRATFSHTGLYAKAVVIRDMEEAEWLGEVIIGKRNQQEFDEKFVGRCTPDFDVENDLKKIGVVNQTTMLASGTQAISDFLRGIMAQKFGETEADLHFANTRDTLCYATNDNQSATLELLNVEADLALVVGGYNSSNTSHLVELCDQKFKTFFIRDEEEILSAERIRHFDIHLGGVVESDFLPEKRPMRIVLTSGASCPDAVVDRVIHKILQYIGDADPDIQKALKVLEENLNNGL